MATDRPKLLKALGNFHFGLTPSFIEDLLPRHKILRGCYFRLNLTIIQ